MGLMAFQRRRRELAAQEVKPLEEELNATEGEIESQEVQLTPDDVDNLKIDKVKELLDQLDVKYAHNTKEAKLREKLKDAIS